MKRGRKPRCPFCGSSQSISKGVRKTATMGKRKLRVCKGCKRKFTVGRKPQEAKKAGAKPAVTETKRSDAKPAVSEKAQAPAS